MSGCALCGRPLDDAATIGTTSRHGHPSRRVACLQCSLVQVSPQPTQQALATFYESHAYRSEHGPVPITVGGLAGQRTYHPNDGDYVDALIKMGRYRAGWAWEHAGLVPGMRLLEIGSGDGYTLAEFAKRGLDCTGVEPDKEEAKLSATRCPTNAKVIAAGFAEAPYEPPYDVIVSYHVLEHLGDPLSALRAWQELLTPRGALVIEVPNILAPSLPVDTKHFQWVHLFDFSEHTLRASLMVAGFEVLEMACNGGNLRTVSRPAATSEPYDMPHGGAYVEGWLDAIRSLGEST